MSMDQAASQSALLLTVALSAVYLQWAERASAFGALFAASLILAGMSLIYLKRIPDAPVSPAAKEGGEGVDGYVASHQQKTKLTAHIMVLYAIASGKEMMVPSVNQLCRDMKLDAKDASLVLREAGFTVKKNAAGDVGASLSVPLKFPPPKRVKRS